jgi:hypothetical protein
MDVTVSRPWRLFFQHKAWTLKAKSGATCGAFAPGPPSGLFLEECPVRPKPRSILITRCAPFRCPND